MRVLLAAALLVLGGAAHAAPGRERLTIDTASGPHGFEVEVMRERPDLEKGLMFRKIMAADHGMLFDFAQPQTVSMWMKNTYLPLDMVFIDKAGTVINVAHDAKPLSEAIIPSRGTVLGVLEINAGVAEAIGLKAGDVVHASIFHHP
ncbi:DUF192 domain-containing protein [Lichenihabitans sp. Uapishka_5]|uniref:DUF192 domain-containing protein n=1 Tax=Lichenihabitans sp. Uapishka_5 TaxID=3037302 RepID=UPI0029E7D430|nr:DUF192 domain-containing protein [Lichenihabitans sp. Uapishka_5]MDX7952521.1 DUF192 domain-containing protein [Lichenihabitans sp. Uapishka_5]